MPRVPANAPADALTVPPPPIADSRSHHSRFVIAPNSVSNAHIPANRSPAVRVGSIRALM